MFTINLLGNIEPLSVYVARPNGEILGCLDNEIVADTANIELALNDYYQLSFDIKRDPTQALSWYDYLQDGMYVLVEKIGLFKINEPSRTLTGDTDSKSITATSCNIELDDKNLYISINMGTKTSLEYLVSDGEHDNGELHFTYNNKDDFELLIDPYRGIPIDWIVIQNKFKEQLETFLDEYQNGYYATLNGNGSATITNADKVAKFKAMIDLIPRLQTRFDRNYQAVTNPSGNPKELGYYVYSSGTYVLTNDTSVVSGTTYYSWNGEYTPISLVEFTYTNEVVTQIDTTPGYSTQIQRLISFYETYAPQLSLLDLVLEETGGDWRVGSIYGVDIGDYTIANRKAQFELDGEAIYSFLSSSLAKYLECIVQYDIFARTVNISPIQYFKPITLPSGSPKDYGVYEYVNFKYIKSTDESINNSKTYYQLVYEIGQDTGIVMSYDNLVNSLGVSSNEDKLTTRLFVTGGNDMNIRRVNFGMDYIVDLSYKMNATDEHNHRIFVSDSFASKYNRYLAYREQQRESYIAYSLEYEKLLKEINELKYRVPNDDLKNDWSTFSMEDLQTYRTAYLNSLNTLITLYKEDYGRQPNALNQDTSVNEDYIKNTEYWYDYQAYKSLIDEVECAIATFPYYSNQEKWTEANKTQYKDKIKAWETDFSLFGTVEITNKIETYKTEMEILAEKSVIRLRPKTETRSWADFPDKASYNYNENIYYWYPKSWNELTDEEKILYGNLSANYTMYYDTYKVHYDNYCLAKAKLFSLNTELHALETQLQTAEGYMEQIAEAVQLENYNYNNDTFTPDEIQTIYRMYKDADYSNENFVTTNITTPDEEFEILKGLLNDGIEKLSSYSRPQFDVDVDVDNLLALPDFQPFWSVFKNGNYMYVQYKDDVYMKLRMVSFSFNPCLPSAKDFKITFSNQIRSNVGVSDLESLLGNDGGSSGRSSSVSGGGSGGVFGTIDGIDITISNTMLSKLLKSESFGTRVSNIILDTIKTNAITAQSATFGDVHTSLSISEKGIKGIVATAQKQYDESTLPSGKSITLYGYGHPYNDMGYNASDFSSATDLYLDQNNGWVYYPNGSSWSRLQSGGQNVVLKTNKEYLGSQIIQTANSITSTVAASQDKYKIPTGLTIDYFGYGEPTTDKYSDVANGKKYLDQNNGWVYIANGTSWARMTDNGQNVVLEKVTETLQSQIQQTERSIKSTVANSQSKYYLEDYGITLYGYGHPYNDMGYNASDFSSATDLYLDQNNGWVYYPNGSSWSRLQSGGQNVELKTNTEYLGSEILQTQNSIILTVAGVQDIYDEGNMDILYYGNGDPTADEYDPSVTNAKYLDLLTGYVWIPNGTTSWQKWWIGSGYLKLQKMTDSLQAQITINTDNIALKADRLELNGYVTINSVANGTTTIDGACISTGAIKSYGYNGSNNGIDNTSGSIINLEDGKFNFGGGKLKWNGTSLFVEGNITATSGQIGHWAIEQDGVFLKGTSIEKDNVSYRAWAKQTRVGKSNSALLDKFGFTVHMSQSKPYFHYWARDIGGGTYMLYEQADENKINAVGGIYYLRPFYNANDYLVAQFENGSGSMTDKYCLINQTYNGNELVGQLIILSSGEVPHYSPNNRYDDDLCINSDYTNPIYKTVKTNNGTSFFVSNDDSKNKVLLDYDKENITKDGYTYLMSKSGVNDNAPIIAINTQLDNSDNPNFNTSKIVLYSDGLIKSESVNTGTIIADVFETNNDNEFTITDKNYQNITLTNYVKNILRACNVPIS